MALRYMVVAGLVALSSATGAMAEERHIVVLHSMTGPAAFIGASVVDGARLAVEQAKASGEFGDDTLKVTYADDATDRTQTMSLISRYANDPSVLMIYGPTSTAVSGAAAAAANELEIATISTANTEAVLEAGPWTFIAQQQSPIILSYISSYAADKLGVKECAIVGIRDVESYVAMRQDFVKGVEAKGVKIVSTDQFAQNDSDFTSLATSIASSKQDCVFISAPPAQGANFIVQLRNAGLDPETKVIGHNAFSSPALLDTGGAAVEGVYFVADWVPGGYDDFSRSFDEAFSARYNRPADNWNAVGYGNMRVILTALKNAGDNPTRESFRDALAATKDVPVPAGQGSYSLDEHRRPQIGMNVLVVKDGQFLLAP